MTEIATIDWFGRWGTSVFSENTAIFLIQHIPCTQMSDAGPMVLWFLHLCSKFSTSHSVKVLKLYQLISSKIIGSH